MVSHCCPLSVIQSSPLSKLRCLRLNYNEFNNNNNNDTVEAVSKALEEIIHRACGQLEEIQLSDCCLTHKAFARCTRRRNRNDDQHRDGMYVGQFKPFSFYEVTKWSHLLLNSSQGVYSTLFWVNVTTF